MLARQSMMSLRLFSEVFVLSQCSVRAWVGTMAPKAKSSAGPKKVSETAALKAATLLADRDQQVFEKVKENKDDGEDEDSDDGMSIRRRRGMRRVMSRRAAATATTR